MENKWMEMLYEALASQYGIVVVTSDVVRAKQALYRARQSANDPELTGLSFHTSPVLPNEEIWIVKKSSSESG